MQKQATVTVQGVEFTVEGDYTPYTPATMYASNGDPGDPAEGGNLEDAIIRIGEQDVGHVLSAVVFNAVLEAAEEAAAEQGGPEPEEYDE